MVDVSDTGFLPRLATPVPCHVLVVDDDELIRAQLLSLLQLDGYEVHGAGSGAEALLMLAATPCQIVLTDWLMPDMDGLSLCRALRLRDSARHTYVLLLTVRGNASDIMVGLGAGADDYVVKGAPAAELLARVAVGRRGNGHEPTLPISGRDDRRPSMTDPLTGAYNRRFLTKYLPRELERAGRYGEPLSILSCDIDNLQRINDGFGNAAGDQVLLAFVALSMTGMRESIDWIARVGGEEFVIVLPETTLDGAGKVAERVHLALRNSTVATRSGPVHATVSIGGTTLESAQLGSVTVAKLLLAADRCLRLSKHKGQGLSTCLTPARAEQLSSHLH